MADHTLGSLVAPNLEPENRGFNFPALVGGKNFAVKPGVIRLLPKFGGKPHEDPIQHLDEFLEVCSVTKPADITEEQMMLRVFSFSLTEEEKDWYHTLLPRSASTWLELKKLFMNKFFPATTLSMLKKQICNIEQSEEESLYDYYERFKKLLANCPYHGFCGTRSDDVSPLWSEC